MIFTQYGVPVTRVVRVNESTGEAEIEWESDKDCRLGGTVRVVRRTRPLISLRADGGIAEIVAAAEILIGADGQVQHRNPSAPSAQ